MLQKTQLAEAINPSAREAQKLLSNYNNLKERLTKEYEDQAELRRSQLQDVAELHRLNSKITEYNETERAKRLKERQVKKFETESLLQNCNQRKKEISDELQRAHELKKNQESLRRNIDDNIKYRNYNSKVDNLTHELDTLQQRQVEIGSSKMIEADILKLNQERDRLLSELNRCRGTMSVYVSNISKNKIDLKQPQYKDIDKRYVDQLIQLKTAEMANKILIDTIMPLTIFQVLMQSGDAKLEMRGRCSADQKALLHASVACERKLIVDWVPASDLEELTIEAPTTF